MYLHIGGAKMVFAGGIVGIFDLRLRQNAINKQFLETAPSTRFLDTAKFSENKSFVVLEKDVLLSPIVPLTLARRCGEQFRGGQS